MKSSDSGRKQYNKIKRCSLNSLHPAGGLLICITSNLGNTCMWIGCANMDSNGVTKKRYSSICVLIYVCCINICMCIIIICEYYSTF